MTDARAETGDEDAESTRVLLERILGVIVSLPEAVSVQATVVNETTFFTARMAEVDTNTLIDRDRRTIQALRMILGAVGLRHQRRFCLEIEQLSG